MKMSNRIQKLFESDQKDRDVGWSNIDFDKMLENDTFRLREAQTIYDEVDKNGLELSAEDLYKWLLSSITVKKPLIF